jgi:hypothetical protein
MSEVLAERFGKTAQQGLGNVMDQSQQAIERVNTFYDNSIAKLQESYDASILQAKQSLQESLSSISYNRMASASAKQQNTISAWKDYYNNVNQAKIQAASFKAQYDLWKQQQDSQLAATSGFNLANANTYNTGVQESFDPNNYTTSAAPINDAGKINSVYQMRPTSQYDPDEWWNQHQQQQYPSIFPNNEAVNNATNYLNNKTNQGG